jgi:hypothetical protein
MSLWHIIVEITPFIILLYPSSPIPVIVSTGLIFPFTYMYTQYLHHIHLPTPSPHILSHPTGTNSTERTCYTLLFSVFVKKWHFFFLFKRTLHWFPCDISMYIFIITQIGSFPLFFSFLPYSLFYGNFNIKKSLKAFNKPFILITINRSFFSSLFFQ